MTNRTMMMAAAAACALQLQAAKVATVVVRDDSGRTDGLSDVTARCEVKPGSEYDPAACARDVRALRDTGEFADITVDALHGATGVEVRYTVKRKLRFQGPLNVEGADYWSTGKIADFADLKDGYAYAEADYAAAAARVERKYRQKHFSTARVTYRVDPVAGSDDDVNVTLVIAEGPRVKVRKYLFEGAETAEDADTCEVLEEKSWWNPFSEVFSGDDLRAAFGQYPWWNPLGWFSDDPVSEQDFREACDKVTEVFRNRGYLDAVVNMPEIRPCEEDEGKCDVVFKVAPGPLYRVGELSVTGVKNYPDGAVLNANTLVKPGDVAGQDTLEKAADQLRVFCESGDNPLAETRVEVRRIPVSDDTVDVVFAVTEGVPVTIDRVLVRGNDYTKDKVIRREIALSPGDRMMADKAEQSKRRLENLRYFERVRYYLERPEFAAPAKPGEPELRDLVYEVSEKNTGQFMVGVGASSVDSVYGTVELSESNFDLFRPWRFRGGGQKGRILVQAGPRIQTYEASVTEPYFLDRVLELTVEGYRRQRWYDEYDAIRNGAAVTLSYPVKFWPTWRTTGRLGVRVAGEFVQMDDVTGDYYYLDKGFGSHRAGSYGPAFRWQDDEYGDSWEVPVRLFWQNDTRDNFLTPTRGHRALVYGELAGGDNNYWKIGLNYRQYWNVWKRFNHVLSFGVRGDTIDAFSGDLPIYDRLFLGGPRSIRGVEYREIAPRIWSMANKRGGHAPWGGQTAWMFTAEYTVPVVKFVRVAAFTDLGSVGEDSFDFSTDYFCWSAGLGLRLDIESFPIRLDVAFPFVKPDDGVEKQAFSFTVGWDF